MNTFFATLPIFLIIAAGYILTRNRIAENRWVNPLNNFVYFIALPALIILSLMKLDLSTSSLQLTLLASTVISLIAALLFAGISVCLPFPTKTRVTIFLTAILGNSIFLGIPLAQVMTPDISKEVITTVSVVFFTTALVSSLIIIEIWLRKSRSGGHIAESLIKNPIIVALAVGLILAIIPIPKTAADFIATPLQLLAQTASPLALFALGGFLTRHRFTRSHWLSITIASGLKLTVLPLFFIALLGLTTLDGASIELQTLLAATPTAVTAFVLTEKYKLSSELAGAVMLTSTVISVVSIPLLMQIS
jgi:hypothetical protein